MGKRDRRILVVFGTRPEAIKLAPVIRQLRTLKRHEIIVCVTAQHRQLLDQVLRLFDISPEVDLDLMRENQSLGELTAVMLTSLRTTLRELGPSMVVVQGDTTTTLATSLAAFYERIPIAHVEAGLRTGDISAPWPEEMNRVVTTLLSELHFAPTPGARKNLRRAGVPRDRIFVTGNTGVDALLETEAMLKSDPDLRAGEEERFSFLDPLKRLLLVTGHRRESFGEGLDSICHALADLVERHDDIEIVFPVHLNPQVREPVKKILVNRERIHLIDPTEYLPLVYLLKRCYFVLTDSGGIQEEAPSFGKPVLVLRETTERPEAVKAGTAKLVGTDRRGIVREAEKLLREPDHYARMSRAGNPFGDGKAAVRIAKILKARLA